VTIKSLHCPEGSAGGHSPPLIATGDCGRFGNFLGQYAVMLAAQAAANFTPILFYKKKKYLSKVLWNT